MAKQSKLERNLAGPSLVEIVLAAILSALLGVIVGAVLLIVKPSESVKALPDELERGTVYYVEGARSSSNSSQWIRKRQILLAGEKGSIQLTEQELNAWATAALKKPVQSETASTTLAIVPDLPDFRIQDGTIQIAVPTTIAVVGITLPVTVLARGDFEQTPEGFRFHPSQLYVGSLPAVRLPSVSEYLMRRLLVAEAVPAEVTTAWKRLSDVRIAGNQLHLSIP